MTSRIPAKINTFQTLKDRNVPVETIVDVGVLTGTPELVQFWPDTPHILFEPVIEFSTKIESYYSRVPHELHVAAVGAQSGTIHLKTMSKVDSEISHSYIVNEGSENTREVPIVTLDDFFERRRLGRPYLLKIDIDGKELDVLKGAKETLKHCSVVIVEVAGSEVAARLAAVQSAGFHLFDLSEPCYYDGAFWQCDAVFIREDIFREKFKQIGAKVDTALYSTFRG